MHRLRHARLRFDDEAGISLIEVMMATFVLAVAILGLASVASASLVSLRISRDRQAATDAATSTLESMRLEQFGSVALLESDVSPLGSCDDVTGEAYVTTTDPSLALPIEEAGLGPKGNITVRTRVTWVDEGNDQDCADSERNFKRVRVTASWEDRGELRQLVEETVVAPAGRGLPLPEFRLGSPDVVLNFDPTEVAATEEKCLSHVLRNIGADDRYDYVVARLDGSSTPALTVADVANDAFRAPNQGSAEPGSWRVRAFLQYDGEDLGDLHPLPSASLPAGVERMVDGGDGDANGRPEASAVVETGSQARFYVCYKPDDKVDSDREYEFEVTVHSRFDENATQVVTHSLTTYPGIHQWFLYDTDDSQDHARLVQSGSNWVAPVYPMGPLDGSLDGLGGTLLNYDTDVDTRPGITLEKGGTETRYALWHEQVTSATELVSARLELWVSAPTLFSTPLAGDLTQTLEVSLTVLAKNEKNVVSTPVSTTFDLTHIAGVSGWKRASFTLPIATPIQLEKDQFLRLRVACAATSGDDCMLAYDADSDGQPLTLDAYQSHLEVRTR